MSTTKRGHSRKNRGANGGSGEESPTPKGQVAADGNGTRVGKALSLLGFCSRRDAERLIAEGRVQVNDRRVDHPATMVDVARDRLTVDGRTVSVKTTPRYVALHKPRGVVSTTRDAHAERTVVDLIPGTERLYPVGRLDKDSEGLILLTNDGEFTNLVTHPRYEIDKEYQALIADFPSARTLATLRRGVELDGQRTAPAQAEIQRRAPEGVWLRLVLREGRNREVRRMLEAVGFPTERLIRTRIGPVRLGDLRSGQHRTLREEEIEGLRQAARDALQRALDAEEPERGTGAFAVPRVRRGKGERYRLAGDVSVPVAPSSPSFVIAIDGPSGAGKTTVGELLAKRLGGVFLDTGVLYRALTLLALEDDVPTDDGARLAAMAQDLAVVVRPRAEVDGGGSEVVLDGDDVTEAIRTPEVDQNVSAVAAHPEVRAALVPAQREAVRGTTAVVVGRDIGTVIFPNADLKVFLDASLPERARRRMQQQGDTDLDATLHALEGRDALDREREASPLTRAPDAVQVDTDHLSIAEVIDQLAGLAILLKDRG